jgi:hypothetical protein
MRLLPSALALLLVASTSPALAQSTDDAADAKAPSKDAKAPSKDAKAADPECTPRTGRDGKPIVLPTRCGPPKPATPPAPPPEPEKPIETYDAEGNPAGASENPDAPTTAYDTQPEPPAPVAAEAEEEEAPEVEPPYPLALRDRPQVLNKGMLEVGLDLPYSLDPGHISAVLRAAYSINGKLQVGFHYLFGTATDDGSFNGKAFSIDAEYELLSWVSAQLSLPTGVSPYAQGLTLGLPVKVKLPGRLALEVLRDLATVKLYRYAPSLTNAAETEGLFAADKVGGIVPDGELNLGGRVIFQAKPSLAIDGRYNVRMIDFSSEDAPTELTLGLTYSRWKRFDLGLRLGWYDLGEAPDGLGGQLGAALRLF